MNPRHSAISAGSMNPALLLASQSKNISVVITAHRRVKLPVDYMSLIHVALVASQQSDMDCKAVSDPDGNNSDRDLSSNVAKAIY